MIIVFKKRRHITFSYNIHKRLQTYIRVCKARSLRTLHSMFSIRVKSFEDIITSLAITHHEARSFRPTRV
jgi:hypothetical protein